MRCYLNGYTLVMAIPDGLSGFRSRTERADIDIGIRPKVEEYRQILSTMPGITEEAARKSAAALERSLYVQAAKQAAGLTATVEAEAAKQAKAVEAAAAKERAALESAAEKAKRAQEAAAEKTSKAWSDTGKKVGELAGGPWSKLGQVVFEMVPKATEANAALGAVVATGAGLAGVATVGAAAVGILYEIATAAGAAEERLIKTGKAAEIPPEAKASIEKYREETTTLRSELDLLEVSLGSGVVGALSEVTHEVTGAIELWGSFKGTIEEAVGILGQAEGVGTLISGLKQWYGYTDKLIMAQITLGASIPFNAMRKYASAAADAYEAQEKASKGASAAAVDYMIQEAEVDDDIRKNQAKLADDILKKRKETLEKEAQADIEAGKKEEARQKAAYQQQLKEDKAFRAAVAADRTKMRDDAAHEAWKRDQETTAAFQQTIDEQSQALAEADAERLDQYDMYLRQRADMAEAEAQYEIEAAAAAQERAAQAAQATVDTLAQLTKSIGAFQSELYAGQIEQEQRAAQGHEQQLRLIQDELGANQDAIAQAKKDGDAGRLYDLQQHRKALLAKENQQKTYLQREQSAIQDLAKGQRSLAIFQVRVDEAVAIMKAYADLGPAFGTVAAVGLELDAETQISQIKREPLPSFLHGTSAVPGTRGQPQTIEAHGGEGVVVDAGFDRLGRLLVDAINRGTDATGQLGRLMGRSTQAGGGGDVYIDRRKVGRVVRGGPRDPRMVGFVNPYNRGG